MKRRKEMKRRTKLMIYACLSVSLVAGAFGVSSVVAKTSADGSLISADLVMENGASLYLSEDGSNSGLKFTYTINGYDAVEDADRTFGMLVVPYDYLTKAGITDLTAETNDYIPTLQNAVGDTISNDPIVEMLTPTANGEVSLSLAPMLEQNYVRNFFAIGFEAITTDNGVTQTTTYQYAQQADNVRSVFEVANIAMNKFRHYEWTSSAQDQAEYALLETYEEDLTAYVSDGLTFVYGTANLDISLNATYVGGPANVKINTAKETGKESIELAMHWDMDTASLTRGNTTATVDLGGVCVGEDLSVAVLKDETELELYKNSKNASFFSADELATDRAYSTVRFNNGGYYNSASGYVKDSLGYIAFTNPDSEDGTYTLDENGWYVDFYFQGNNMPNVEFFSTKKSAYVFNDDGRSGYVVSNGAGSTTMYKRWDLIQQNSLYNCSSSADKTGLTDSYTWSNKNHRYNGLFHYLHFMNYSVTGYSGWDASQTTLAGAFVDSDSSYKEQLCDRASSGFKQVKYDASYFSMLNLIKDETIKWHYVVGMYKDSDGKVYVDSKLYKVDENGNDIDSDTATDGVQPYATAKLLADTITDENTVRTGYIVVHGAMKGQVSEVGDRGYTKFAYTLPARASA